MRIVKEYPDGIFCWADLATTDVAASKAFYGRLFRWSFDDQPLPGGGIYSTAQIEGHTVAGLGEMNPEMREQGMHPFWSTYVKHSDIDTVAERVKGAGGQLMVEPMEIMEEGRMLMAVDPTGAAFGVWEPRRHTGAQVVNQPHSLVWTEVQTRDEDAARDFYEMVFDWEYGTDPNGYGLFKQNGRTHAGLIQMDENWPSDVPANWTLYFMVEDTDATAKRVEELGGAIMVPATDAGELGRFAVARDPQGAVFTIMQFNGPTDDTLLT